MISTRKLFISSSSKRSISSSTMSAYNKRNTNKQQSNFNNSNSNSSSSNDPTLPEYYNTHNSTHSNQYNYTTTQPQHPSSQYNYNNNNNHNNQKTKYDYSAYTSPITHSTSISNSNYVPPHLRSCTVHSNLDQSPAIGLTRYGTGEPPWSRSEGGEGRGGGGAGEYDYRASYTGRNDVGGAGSYNATRFNPNSTPFYPQNSRASTSQSSYQSDLNYRPYSTTSQSQAPYRSRSPPRSDYNYNNDTTHDYSYPDRSNNYPSTRSQNAPSSNYNNGHQSNNQSNTYQQRNRSPPPSVSLNKWILNTNTGPRKKMNRNVPTPLPSQSYLDVTTLPSITILATSNKNMKVIKKEVEPPLLILDLNNTLLCRATRTSHGSRNATLRPYLSTFLSYVCGSTSHPRSPTYQPIVYSSARNANVLQMLLSMSLISAQRVQSHPVGTAWMSEEGDPLKLVWSRENMGLSTEEFNEDVKTVKDLEGVWKILGMGKGEMDGVKGGGVRRTVLLDDEAQKAAMQPHNHLPISPFSPLNHLQSAASPSNKSYRRTRERSPSPYSSSIPPTPSSTPSDLTNIHSSTTPTEESTVSKVDASLLSTIYLLEILRFQSNIPNFIRNDGLKVYYDMGEEELIKRGEEICEAMGIKVHANGEWDGLWREW